LRRSFSSFHAIKSIPVALAPSREGAGDRRRGERGAAAAAAAAWWCTSEGVDFGKGVNTDDGVWERRALDEKYHLFDGTAHGKKKCI